MAPELVVPATIPRIQLTLLAIASCALLYGCPSGSGENLTGNGRPVDEVNDPGPVAPSADFAAIQANVLTPVCTVCHAGAAAPVGLRLDAANSYDSLVGVASIQVPAILRVAPGDPDNSYLIQKLDGTAAVGGQMPIGGPFLSTATVALIRQWISDGAQRPAAPSPNVPPTVLSVVPANGSALGAVPADIVVVFSKNMDASLFSDLTFTLTASGGDGTFGDGNALLIAPASVSLLATDPTTATMDLTGIALADDDYEIRLIGEGATALADESGLLLDGNGDGTAGDDFTAQFTLTTQIATQATWRSIQDTVFTPICTQCHIAGGIADFLRLDEANSYAMLVGVPSTEQPSLLRVAPLDADASYLTQKLEGTAAVGDQMPSGGPPLPDETIAAIRLWITQGAVMNPGDPIPDVVPPVVALAAPVSPLIGTVTLSAGASDSSGVTAVRFLVDGVVLDTQTVSPYAVSWDTTTVANGSYTLTAEADDAAGNTGVSAALVVEVDNPDSTAPTVMLVDPGSPLGGMVNLAVNASDAVGVTVVRLFVDDVLLAADDSAPYQFVWDTSALANGDYVLRAEADDAAGNVGQSQSVTVTVDNGAPPDTEAPTVSIDAITSPVSGIVDVTLQASDNVGVTAVRLFVDGNLIGATSSAPYTIAWDTSALANGDYVLRAEADDAAGNVGQSQNVTVTVDNPDTEAPTVSIDAIASPASGIVDVTLLASDNVGVTAVRLFVDGDLIGATSSVPYTIAWDTTAALLDGDYMLSAEADDAAGNTGVATPLVVTVVNGGPQATLDWIQANIFTPTCTIGCHTDGGIAGLFLRLDPANAFAELVNQPTTQLDGQPPFRVLPGDPNNSSLVQRLEGTLPLMPLLGTQLPQIEIDAVRQWISTGAAPGTADTVAPVTLSVPTSPVQVDNPPAQSLREVWP